MHIALSVVNYFHGFLLGFHYYSLGPEFFVNIMSFVDKDQLEPGSSVLTHNKVSNFVHLSIKLFNMLLPIHLFRPCQLWES